MTEQQANLLQVGDWLYCPKVNECFQMGNGDVTDVAIEKKYLHIPKYRSFFDNSTIPLTREILEKNGFEAHTGGRAIDYSFPKEIDTRPVPFASSLCIIQGGDTFFIEDHTLIKFKTVDEFQRLLRLMGYIDFANRFKV